MRTDTVFRFDNTFDVYTRVTEQDPITGQNTISYTLLDSRKGLVLPAGQGLVYLATREPIELMSAIRHVQDRNGTTIFQVSGNPYDMYVTDANPQYDALGSVVGWRHTLARNIPKSVAQNIAEIRETLA
jgi:hypothetical protein